MRVDLKVLRIPVTITILDIPDTPSSEEAERHLRVDHSPSLTFTDGETHVEETSGMHTQHSKSHAEALDTTITHVEVD